MKWRRKVRLDRLKDMSRSERLQIDQTSSQLQGESPLLGHMPNPEAEDDTLEEHKLGFYLTKDEEHPN